jgi:hypothetical protein
MIKVTKKHTYSTKPQTLKHNTHTKTHINTCTHIEDSIARSNKNQSNIKSDVRDTEDTSHEGASQEGGSSQHVGVNNNNNNNNVSDNMGSDQYYLSNM